MSRKALEIEVVAPTVGRPERAEVMAESWNETRVSTRTSLVLALDDNDTYLPNYLSFSHGRPWFAIPCPTGSMVKRTNLVAITSTADIVGWAADDNLFVTKGWDHEVRRAFEDPAITTVNTNDLLVNDAKGGVYFVRKKVIDRLGWFFPPMLEHLYVDFAVTEMAKRAGTYLYLPEVIIEHIHPYAGKAEWDDGYRSVNNPEQDQRDRTAFYSWWESEAAERAVEVLRECSTVS